MGTKEIVIGAEKRYANIKLIEKMKKFIKESKGHKTGKITILDIKYSQDESNNYYLFLIDTELPLQNSSEYVRTIVENVLKSEKIRPFISSAKEIENIKETIDYNKTDEFVNNINRELEKIENVNISNYHHGYGKQQYIHNKSVYNHYKDYIYLQTDFSKNTIGKITLTISIDPLYNVHAENLSFTLKNDFSEKDVALELYNLVNKYLEQIYNANKSFILKFDKKDIEMLYNKYPEDDYLKSLVGMNKFNLLENTLNEISDKNFINDIAAELYGSKLNGLDKYVDGVFILSNDSYERATGEHLFIEFDYKDNKLQLSFDTNSPSELEDLEYTFDEGYSPLDIAQILIEFIDKRLEQIYLYNKEYAKEYDKEDVEMLYKKYPNDNYLKSLLGINKYKLFDYYNFHINKINNLK